VFLWIAALTAKTRNNDVLPAFCSPIIVMSISVALHPAKGQKSVKRKHHIDGNNNPSGWSLKHAIAKEMDGEAVRHQPAPQP
jgi:hypothetical protein